MTVLQVSDLRFGYADDTLFEGVTFSLALGERAALVAPNGAGKSTLLRLIGKELEPDAGNVVIKKEASFGYYRQSHELAATGDVLSAFMSAFGDIVEARRALVAAQEAAGAGDAAALDRLAQATERYHVAGGDALEHKVAAIAAKLGFSDADLARPVASLSGGERGRLHLGVVLAQQPDLLLLDEPTNHLDLDTIAWLESWLKSYRGAVLVVSHDRAFLDATCPTTLEVGTRGLRVYPLRYSDYAVQREADLARERALVEKQQAYIEKTKEFIRKNTAGQKANQAQSRKKTLARLEELEQPEDVWAVAEKIAFRFAPAARSGDIVLDAKDMSAERGGRKLFEGVDLLVRRGERIGIVGPNGAGKTTLLKVLADRGDRALDRASIRRGTNLQIGYYDQHLGEVDPKRTAVEEIRSVRGDLNAEGARTYLARFRFYGDDALRVVAGFSGGERARLALAKLLLEPKNLLFLDEPTNHLDIPAAEILEEALAGFEGTVILVSHDRRFLDNVTTRVVSVRDGKVDVFNGGFRDFAAATTTKPKPTAPPPPKKEAPKKEPPKKVDHDAHRQASRDREKSKRRVKELEDLIAAGEKQLATMRAELKEDPGGDWAKIAKLATEEQAMAKKVETMLAEWERLSAQL
ncbi:MAG: ABC-F family ATP-binding cassette domain-containing protein [Labilithrix sp.]|nr:ABC-F family ATP-binding cassette domain-containing protein [Labilithrix sp.]MCW5817922.1 ABC-F family ATP-binding cassette domain-containing protein [Labilithrix sp.]